jgi:hypothetical protein
MNEIKWYEIKIKIRFLNLKNYWVFDLGVSLKALTNFCQIFMNESEWNVMVIQGTLTEEEEGSVQLTSLNWYIVM